MDVPVSRRQAVGLLGTGAAALASHPGTEWRPVPDGRGERPNIVVIMADDLGFGDLSSYGAEDIRTPNIDSLAGRGMRFGGFYANCPVCSPTRASLMTGRFPDLAGVPGVIRTHPGNSFGFLSQGLPILPEVLNRAGYHTALVGKWHLGLEAPNTPVLRGFDHFHGFLGDMMDDYYDHRRHGINYMRLGETEIDPAGHATDLFTRWAVDYIDSRSRSRQPFFLYLAYNAPHTPVQPPEEWMARVKEREPGLSERRAKLAALIEHMDSGIGAVLGAISANGLENDTLIIFTSDNGGQLDAGADNASLRGGKQDMYEGGLRVPAFAVWPGKIAPGSSNGGAVLTMDLFPTICEAAGVPVRHEIDGVSILPLLTGTGLAPEERPLFWMRREGGQYAGRDYYAARLGPWKLLQNSPFEPYRLYNLDFDPLENNMVGQTHRMYGKLAGMLQDHIIKAGAVPWRDSLLSHGLFE